MKFAIVIAVFAASAAPARAADGWEDLSLLDVRVADVLKAPTGAPGGAIARIDRRLKLATCPEQAVIETPTNGAMAIRCKSLGWRVRVPLSSGSVLSAEATEPSIRKGDLIEIDYGGDGFSASASGVALDDAALGTTVRVKTSAISTITAVVSGSGRASVSP